MMNDNKPYQSIVSHYETCLARFGDSHLGVNWTNAVDTDKRYQVMLEVIRNTTSDKLITLLDFGCGASHLLDYIKKNGIQGIQYVGLDMSPDFIALSQQKYPDIEFLQMDVLDSNAILPQFDYIVMNGVFTIKRELSFEEMFTYFSAVIEKVFPFCNQGMAFNVMSKQVDWEREDLFHLSLDKIAGLLTQKVNRHFVIRNDYGLYEYTVYLYHYASL